LPLIEQEKIILKIYHQKSLLIKKIFLIFIIFFHLSLVQSLTMIILGSKAPKDNPHYGGVFRIKSFSPKFRMELDPASPKSFIFISEQIYDGLVKLDKNFKIIPALAEYWKISADGKDYRFYLRRGVRFHHGQELTAQDVKYSLERLLDRKINSPYAQFFLRRVVGAKEFWEEKAADVKGFRVIDKYTFEIQWLRPYVSALYLLSLHFCKILPQALAQGREDKFFRKPSGTGPFKFSYWIRTPRLEVVGVRLERNDNYFGSRAYLKTVEFCPLYSLDHFLNEDIHTIPVVSAKLLQGGYQIFEDGSLQNVFLGMSCHLPPLNNQLLRKAILYALNKKEIVHRAYEIERIKKVTNSYIPSRLPGFFPTEDENTYNLERAEELFKKARIDSSQSDLTLILFIQLPKTEVKYKIFKELKRQLNFLGINLKLSYFKSSTRVRNSKKPYLILVERLMNFPDPEDMIRPLFFSKSEFNLFGYSNSVLDNLLEKSETEKSWSRRIDLFHQMEKILLSDLPAIPLYSQQNRIAMQPYVRGVEVPPLGLYYLEARKIWLNK